jgi:hypothetical protein
MLLNNTVLKDKTKTKINLKKAKNKRPQLNLVN